MITSLLTRHEIRLNQVFGRRLQRASMEINQPLVGHTMAAQHLETVSRFDASRNHRLVTNLPHDPYSVTACKNGHVRQQQAQETSGLQFGHGHQHKAALTLRNRSLTTSTDAGKRVDTLARTLPISGERVGAAAKRCR